MREQIRARTAACHVDLIAADYCTQQNRGLFSRVRVSDVLRTGLIPEGKADMTTITGFEMDIKLLVRGRGGPKGITG